MMLVSDGALAGLPPGVLVTALPAKLPASPRDLAQVDWLVKKYALTVLPSAALLRSRGLSVRPSAAREAFRGFGDMQALASALKVGPTTLVTGPMASESNIKGTNLARFRALAFAAPGALVRGSAVPEEPALVLTEPRSPSGHDNGVLTASEIALLRLDADWVLLAGDASPDAVAADGPVTLARSFVHAGARSVLVSHGASAQAAAEITARVAEESAAGVAKAEALRRSMLALMNAAGDPQRAHPRYWAGLTVVGEGNSQWSAGRQPAGVAVQPAVEQASEAKLEVAEKQRPATAESQGNPIAKAVAAVTGFLGQVERGRGAAPQTQAQSQMQDQPPPQPKPQPQVEPKPQVAVAPVRPEPAPIRAEPLASAPVPAPVLAPAPAPADAPPPEAAGANP
ncbi:MAG: CHAT domain-containing protein, partial [Myxococcota bacterium]